MWFLLSVLGQWFKRIVFMMFLSFLLVGLRPFQAHAMNAITGSTTWGTMLEEADPQEFRLENIIGKQVWDLDKIKLDGKQNRMTLSLGPLTQTLDFDDFSGGVEADMQIAKVGVMGDPDGGGRNYVYIKAGCGMAEVELQLEYEPGMGAITTSAALADVQPKPYRFVLTNTMTGETWTHAGVAGKDQDPREHQLSLSRLKNNLRAYLGQSVRLEGVFDYIYPCQECEQPVLKDNGVVLKVFYPCYLEPGSEPYDQTRVRARAEVIQDNVRGICVELTHVNGIDLKKTYCSRLYE